MPLEYEYRYKKFDKEKIIKKIKDLDGTHHGTWLFRVQVFIHPLEEPNTYIRVRDEGHRITLTFKSNMGNQFVNENEVIINDFDQGCAILLGIGCKKKYYYEKIRDIWHISNTEICWDTNPGRPDIMEIESVSKVQLNKVVKLLNMESEPHDDFRDGDLYKDTFGIDIPKSLDMNFLTVKKDLIKYCTKNKDQFIKLINDQKKLYLSIVPKITPKTKPKIESKKTSKIASKKTSKIASKKTSKIASKKTSKIASKKTSKIASKITSKITSKK
jgi:adenylate cyclase class IV